MDEWTLLANDYKKLPQGCLYIGLRAGAGHLALFSSGIRVYSYRGAPLQNFRITSADMLNLQYWNAAAHPQFAELYLVLVADNEVTTRSYDAGAEPDDV